MKKVIKGGSSHNQNVFNETKDETLRILNELLEYLELVKSTVSGFKSYKDYYENWDGADLTVDRAYKMVKNIWDSL